jgi:hypothetical protein
MVAMPDKVVEGGSAQVKNEKRKKEAPTSLPKRVTG